MEAEIIPINAEARFRAWAEAGGWRVTKGGWPDFLCRRGDELMAVEVKWSDWLSDDQVEALSDLYAAGIATYVWTMGAGLTPYPKAQTRIMRRDEELAELREEVARARAAAAAAEDRAVALTEENRSIFAAWMAERREATRSYRGAVADIRYLLRAVRSRRRHMPRIEAIAQRFETIRVPIRVRRAVESRESSEDRA